MILAYSLEYRSSAQLYERIFLKTLRAAGLGGGYTREHYRLKFYVETKTHTALETFVDHFAKALPHSIFLYGSEAKMVESMPEDLLEYVVQEKLPQPFCPECAAAVLNPESGVYYDIFASCEACGYGTEGERRNYRDDLQPLLMALVGGECVRIDTHSGSFVLGLPSAMPSETVFDLLVSDLATVMQYAVAEEYELQALASFEKPLIRLCTTTQFSQAYSRPEGEALRFGLPGDLLLYLLMEELRHLDLPLLAISEVLDLSTAASFSPVKQNISLRPIEAVVTPSEVVLLSGNRGLPHFPDAGEVQQPISAFYSVIKEHRLAQPQIAGIHLDRDEPNAILVHGEKYGTIEYLSMQFTFDSMASLFHQIVKTDESGEKIVLNYRKAHPELFEQISRIVFDDQIFTIYRLWGIVAIVLGFGDTEDPEIAAKALMAHARCFAGAKGPRIDYKLYSKEGKPYLDPLMTVRTAMSFKLAGVDPQTLSFGVIESFCEFLGNEADQLSQSMEVGAFVLTGSLLSERQIMTKLSREIGGNHALYCNVELPIDGSNARYGGVEL